jgi:hypothetical protein
MTAGQKKTQRMSPLIKTNASQCHRRAEGGFTGARELDSSAPDKVFISISGNQSGTLRSALASSEYKASPTRGE